MTIDPVRIKIEIEIPPGVSLKFDRSEFALIAKTLGDVETPTRGEPDQLHSLSLCSFVHPGTNAGVVSSGTGQLGSICVEVTGSLPAGKTLVGAWIFIDQTGGSSALRPMPGDVPPYLKTNPNWQVDPISGAAFGTGVTNTINVFLKYNNGSVPEIVGPFDKTFSGYRSLNGATDCSPNVTTLSHTTVPQRWRFLGGPFVGVSVEVFCKEHMLRLLSDSSTDWKWSNGGCGVKFPRVELTLPRCGCGPCQLILMHGDVTVKYTHPSGAWNALGKNQFTSVSLRGLSLDSVVPGAVDVCPA